MSSQSGGISQSNTGSMSGGMQASIGDNTQQVMHSQTSKPQGLSKGEVRELLDQLKEIVRDSLMPESFKKKAESRLESVIHEVEEEETDKQLVGGNLKRVAEVFEDAGKAVESGTNLLGKVEPIFRKLLGWLGLAKGFFGFC